MDAEHISKECSEGRLEDAANPLKEEEGVKLLGFSIYPEVDPMIISSGGDPKDRLLFICIEESRRDSENIRNL